MILLNGKPVELMTFPNGERGGELPIERPDDTDYKITLRYQSDADLLHLIFVKRHISEVWGITPADTISLVIEYMPYSRMDRQKGDWLFTLKSVTEFINELDFDYVEVWEPHSDVTMALLDRAEAVYPTIEFLPKLIDEIGFDKATDYIVFPDAGAEKRYDLDGQGYNILVGHKHRDFQTGKIKSFSLHGERPSVPTMTMPHKAIIIDDLCSYGGTFLAVGTELATKWSTESYLLVAHCENSVYDGKLLNNGHFKGLWTTDSIHGPFGNFGATRSNKVHIYDA